MQTKVSTNGQVVLPGPIRRRLDIRAGDALDAEIEAGRIVLTPRQKRSRRAKIVVSPETGFPALDAGPDAPTLTCKEVAELLSDFP
jgi:AbrB family looped-hinge helix DNA binding protein